MSNGYNAYTRKSKWICINGRYVKHTPKHGKPVNTMNPGKIKAGIGGQMDRFPA